MDKGETFRKQRPEMPKKEGEIMWIKIAKLLSKGVENGIENM